MSDENAGDVSDCAPEQGTDLVERLRQEHRNAVQGGIGWGAWDASEADSIVTIYSQAAAEITRLRRGEFICRQCGVRKDAETNNDIAF